jgi:glucosamine--fructose-6-phosphate aminotransferase (isomerizing)
MLLSVQLAAMHRGRVSLEGIRHLPEKGRIVVKRSDGLAEEIIFGHDFAKFVFIGQGPFYGLACESMLKIKEMALFASEAYHSLEFRHGPISMADSSMLVTCFLSERGRQEELNLLGEVRALGARTLVVCEKADTGIRAVSDHILDLDSGLPEFHRLVLGLPVTQLMAYHAARKKGLDPDHPRNLNQVVEIRKGNG